MRKAKFQYCVLLFLVMWPFIFEVQAQHIDVENLEPHYDSIDTYRRTAQNSSDTLFLAQYHYLEATIAEYKYNIDTIAIDHYLKSQALYDSVDDTLMVVNVNSSLGNIYLNNSMYQEALGIYNEVLNYYIAKEKIGLQAHTYSSLANVYHKLGDDESEDVALDKAERLVQDSFLLGIIKFQRIRRFVDADEFEKGLELLTQALPNIEKNNWAIHSGLLLMFAQCYNGVGQYKKAIVQAKKAISVADGNGQIHALTNAECLLSGLYINEKNYKDALLHSQRCSALKDSSFRADKERMTNALLVRIKEEKATLEKMQLKEERDVKNSQLIARNRLIAILALAFLSFLGLGVVVRKNYKGRIRSAYLIQEKQEELHKEVIRRVKSENKYQQSVALLEGQETERKRMGQDLHDGVGGVLAAVRMQLDKFMNSAPKNSKPIKDAIVGIGHAIQEIRTIARNTLPESLLNGGLVPALEDYISSFIHIGGLSIDLKAYDKVDLPEQKIEMIYRILQELIYNAIKHSDCEHIEVIILKDEQGYVISVSDDGMGFDPAKHQNTAGLQNIRSRVEYIQGEFEIDSKAGVGSHFFVRVNS